MADPIKITQDVAEQAQSVAGATKAAVGAGATDAKSILKSKTFWANVVLGAVGYTQNIPSKYAAPVAAGVNILLRFLTNQPVFGPFGG